MTDRFGRQKSQRWVNSVPTYGDWGDDEYGYENDDGYEYQDEDYELQQQQQQPQKNPTPQRFELPSDHVPPLPAVDIKEYQNQAQSNTATTNGTIPQSDIAPSNLVLSIDKDKHVGELSSDDEIPQVELNNDSFYNPDLKYSDEPEYSPENPHPLSSMGQPGLRLSIYRKDIKSAEEVFDGLPEDDQDENDSIGDEADFKSVIPSSTTKDVPVHETTAFNESVPPSLVLSVDKRNNNGIYSDSSEDDMNDSDDVRSEVGFNETVEHFQKSSSKSTSNTPTIDTRNVKPLIHQSSHQSFEPPTPTYSYSRQASIPPESPSVASETSFNSEYSYQKEPISLRLATHQETTEFSKEQHQEEDKEEKDEPVHPVATNVLEETKTITNQEQPGLVLSVDKRKFDLSDDDDDDDDWGYNSQNSSNDEYADGGLNVPQDSQPDIDSFINELNNSSGGDKSDDILPPLDHDVSLPDFENTSFSKFDEEKPLQQKDEQSHHDYKEEVNNKEDDDDDDYSFPIKPLSISQQKEAHDDYLNTLSGRRQSVRKPPRQSVVFSDDFPGIDVGKLDELHEQEAEEVSQIHEQEQDHGQQHEQEEEEEVEHEEEDATSGHLKEPVNEDGSRKESLELVPPELHLVHSSGSLSTGILSMETSSQKGTDGADEFLPKDVRDSRRISTLSNATFNLGGWTPNTDRFRSQFINDNDSESINYNPEKSTYDNFTKIRNTNSSIAEEISNSSSLSVPETIDAGMPSIREDPASEDEHEHSDTEETNKVEQYHGDDQSINPAMTMSSFNDSVLGDHIYQRPLFKEERLTPAASKEDLLPQKYHSLIPPDARKASDSSETTERARSTSTSTMKTDATVRVTPKVNTPSAITPGKYPVSDWKSIITISQPQDRIAALKQALFKEQEYDSGIQTWLNYALKQEPSFNTHLLIGRVASQAYQNAAHNDLRRHASLRTTVNLVKDKVEGTTGSLGKTTGSFGKKLFSRSKKFIKSTTGDK